MWIALCGSGFVQAMDTSAQIAAPSIVSKPAQAGARIVTLAANADRAKIYYTVDGGEPTASSPMYTAPFLVTSTTTVKAMAVADGSGKSRIAAKRFAIKIPAGMLVWSDEFTKAGGQPDPAVWTYDAGASGWGNHELEDYCAWASTAAPCDATSPNAYVGADGFLHIVARKTPDGKYTSARMKSEGLFSFQYGRLEARIKLPVGQGIWPAFWTLGNSVSYAGWPACGEQDIAERVNGVLTPDWNEGSVHGPGFTGDVGLGKKYYFPSGENAAGWHTYGMIWKPGSVAYYIDDPMKPYVTYTNPASLTALKGAVWPFDNGVSMFFLLNVAVGGDWPGAPDAKTGFPAEMLVDYVRIYAV
ncbi:MAG TPA: chitobiase/beta-hexosaminidase C-terminal domain-containing protein [Acidobacteriaceae bacterium]